MSHSRTPVLDFRLAGVGTFSVDSTLSAEDAHRIAGQLFESKARIRTPTLEGRLARSVHEFDNPEYVDAIVRNMAALPLSSVYAEPDLALLGRTRPTGCPQTMAGIAERISKLGRRLERDIADADGSTVPASRVDALENRIDAFAAPFRDISDRFDAVFPYLRAGFSAEELPSPHDYRTLARRLGLPSTATSSLLLRFCLLPPNRYGLCLRRLGLRYAFSSFEDGCLLNTIVIRQGMCDAEQRAHRAARLCHLVLAPIALAGRRGGADASKQAPAKATLY